MGGRRRDVRGGVQSWISLIASLDEHRLSTLSFSLVLSLLFLPPAALLSPSFSFFGLVCFPEGSATAGLQGPCCSWWRMRRKALDAAYDALLRDRRCGNPGYVSMHVENRGNPLR